MPPLRGKRRAAAAALLAAAGLVLAAALLVRPGEVNLGESRDRERSSGEAREPGSVVIAALGGCELRYPALE